MVKGIYRIVNLKNSKIYIGSTTNFSRRRKEHVKRLRSNKHNNKHLQASFNKFGEENFKFEILEKTEDLIVREQYYIKTLNTMNPKIGYNLSFPHLSGGCKSLRNSSEIRKVVYGICQTTNKILVKYRSVQEARDLLHAGIGHRLNKEDCFVSKMALVTADKYDKFKDYRKQYKKPKLKGRFKGRPVETYNPFNLETIKSYSNPKEVAEDLNSKVGYILKVIRKEKGKGLYKGVGIRWV